ncbi:MAG: hypothetical protein CVU51_02670 [Deltaproteobacteria bacterium HGW-Deltaproteobacteria-1]|nr:MAG: hypothetical protein CVU51_02670 [Deltaproteobacteria bacterium HGW-Deltaproteobacteria-1]
MKLVASLWKKRYDMFITHWVHPVHFPVLKFVLSLVRLLTKTEIVIIVHNVLPHERFRFDTSMTRSVLKIAHRLIVHSAEESKKLMNIVSINHDPVVAFMPLFDQFVTDDDISSSVRISLGLRTKVFLFFGFIREYKGIDLLLEAFHLFAQKQLADYFSDFESDMDFYAIGASRVAAEAMSPTAVCSIITAHRSTELDLYSFFNEPGMVIVLTTGTFCILYYICRINYFT